MLVERERVGLSVETVVGLVSSVTALIVCAWVTWPSWRAEFGPIDDHEPLAWMGADGRLGVVEGWQTFQRIPELSDSDAIARFRPTYMAVRVGQSVAFGDNPTLWYASVFVMFAVTCALLAYVAAVWLVDAAPTDDRRIIAGVSVVAVILVAGMRSWVGIVGRLGPSEQLGLLATAVVALALTCVVRGGSAWWWVAAVSGAWVAVFSKESFAVLVPLLAIVALHVRTRAGWAAVAVSALPVVIVAAVIAPRMGNGDVYGQDVGAGRLGATWDMVSSERYWWWVVCSLVLLVIVMVARRAPALLAFAAWTVLAVVVEAFIYAGRWAPRYRVFLDLCTFAQIVTVCCVAAVPLRNGRREWVAMASVVVIVVGSFFAVRQTFMTRSTVASLTSETVEYDGSLRRAVDIGAGQPVVLIVTSGGDYEPLRSVVDALHRGGVGVTYLDSQIPETTPLGAALHRLSEDGGRGWNLQPLADAPPSVLCLHVRSVLTTADRAGCSRVLVVDTFTM